MKTRTFIICSLILIALASIWFFYFRNKNSSGVSWRTALVEKGNISIEVTATGTLNAVTTVEVGTQVSGTIARLFADFNSQVKKGQIIALLDTTLLAAQVEDMKANLEKAGFSLEQSRREYDRQKALYKINAISISDYDQSVLTYESDSSNLSSAKAQLRKAIINLQYATIRAPISGTVISRQVDVGQTVAASFNTPTLFIIANDLTKMQVEATIDEADIGQVKLDEDVLFNVDAFPNDTFFGKVSQIRLQPVTVQNVVNYIVIIDVANPELKLMPGMTANITVEVNERKNILKVPATALRFTIPAQYALALKLDTSRRVLENSSGWLNVVSGNSIVQKMVTTGLSDGTTTEVSGDIHEGDIVITGIAEEQTTSQAINNPFMPRMPPPASTKKNPQ